MKPIEVIRLNALLNRLQRESEKSQRASDRNYKKAGRGSDDSNGTGDEGWSDTFVLAGQSNGIGWAAQELENLLREMKVI